MGIICKKISQKKEREEDQKGRTEKIDNRKAKLNWGIVNFPEVICNLQKETKQQS